MIAEMREEMQAALSAVLGREVEISEPVLLAGGASKEAWAVDADGERLLVRRAAASVMHAHTLTLAHEFEVLQAAHEAGVTVPRPYGYIPELAGPRGVRDGAARGRDDRAADRPEAGARGRARAAAGCRWRRSWRGSTPSRRSGCRSSRRRGWSGWWTSWTRSASRTRRSSWGCGGCARTARRRGRSVVVHGDFRIGNLVVREDGLVGVLDWEFAHLDDPVRDIAFSLVRAWRFGVPEKRLGGIGDVEPYLERYNELTGFDVLPEELDYWEVAGNVGWASAA